MTEYVFGRVSPIFGYRKHGDSNGEHPNKCPEYGRGLFVTIVIAEMSLIPFYAVGGAYINRRQPTVSKSRDGVAKQGNGNEYEETLVCLIGKDADARFGFEDVQTCSKELRRAKVHRESNRYISNKE